MAWHKGWTVVVALVACGLAVGCSPAPDAGPGPGDIDYRTFTYSGGCGWEKPAVDTVMGRGRQTSAAPRVGEVGSLAQVVQTRRVRLGTPATDYLLVRLQCSIGSATATGWHLLGYDGSQPVDLGIVAAGYGPVDVEQAGGQLVVSHAYRTSTDTGPSDTGRTSYRVAVAGSTPVRLYGDEQPADIPGQVRQWPAGAWRDGIVTLIISAPGDESTYHLGLQTDVRTAVTADTLAERPGGCRPAVVATRTGQRIDPQQTEGWRDQNGTLVRLSLPSDAPGLMSGLGAAPTEETRGLLVTGSGLAPALASATPVAGGVRVTSGAPADVALENTPFDGPTALFRDPTGAALGSGGWSAPGPDGAGPADTDVLMQVMPDTSVPADTGC